MEGTETGIKSHAFVRQCSLTKPSLSPQRVHGWFRLLTEAVGRRKHFAAPAVMPATSDCNGEGTSALSALGATIVSTWYCYCQHLVLLLSALGTAIVSTWYCYCQHLVLLLSALGTAIVSTWYCYCQHLVLLFRALFIVRF